MMVPILLEYDESVDAAYLEFSTAEFHHMVNLDDRRAIDYDEDGSVIGVEILSPSRGVRLEGLPYARDIERVLVARGFPILQGAH
jgi:uncharacterized protein YuzE